MPKIFLRFFYFLFGLFGLSGGTSVLIAYGKGEFEYGTAELIAYLFVSALITFVGFHGAFFTDWRGSNLNNRN